MRETNWLQRAQADAWEGMTELVDEMVAQWRATGEVSDDILNDYRGSGEDVEHGWLARDYRLLEAAELLDQLSEHEEDDEGLWDGADPRRAVSIQAAFTYRNACYSEWRELVETLNNRLDEMRGEIEENADADRDTSVEIEAAGERLIRLYVELGEWDRDLEGDERALTRATWRGAMKGDRTAAMILADWLQEHEQEGRANAIRQAVSAEAPEPDGETDAA